MTYSNFFGTFHPDLMFVGMFMGLFIVPSVTTMKQSKLISKHFASIKITFKF